MTNLSANQRRQEDLIKKLTSAVAFVPACPLKCNKHLQTFRNNIWWVTCCLETKSRRSPRPGNARTVPSGSRSPRPTPSSPPERTNTPSVYTQRQRGLFLSKVKCQLLANKSETMKGHAGLKFWCWTFGASNKNISSTRGSEAAAVYWSSGVSNLSETSCALGAVSLLGSLVLCPLVEAPQPLDENTGKANYIQKSALKPSWTKRWLIKASGPN